MSAGGRTSIGGRSAREARLDGVGWLDGEPDPRYSRSLEIGLAILARYSAERPAQGISDVADGIGLGRSTTHRYIGTLVTLGYLEKTRGHRYCLAQRAADIGRTALESVPVRRSSWEHLKRLRDATGLAVSLGVLLGTRVLYLERARGWRPGQHEIDMGILGLSSGWPLPVHRTSLGKLLLAQLPPEQLAEHIRGIELRRCGSRARS